MKKKIAINGFGRIGRAVFRLLANNPKIDVVAINDITDNETMAHLLKYDSVHGIANGDIIIDGNTLSFQLQKPTLLHEKEVDKLPWRKLQIDIAKERKELEDLMKNKSNNDKKD